MKTTANAAFKSWEEKAYHEVSDSEKLTKVTSVNAYTGELEGEGHVEYLMCYAGDACTYTGLERFEGTLAGKKGSFVLKHEGVYRDGEANTGYTVVPNSGTGELKGLSGQGGYGAGHAHEWPITLEWKLGE
jgi:hypothetical protein